MQLNALVQSRTGPRCPCQHSPGTSNRYVKLPSSSLNTIRCRKFSIGGIWFAASRSRIRSSSSSGEEAELLETLNVEQLNSLLKGAISCEEYSRAAVIKARIDKLVNKDPHARLKRELEAAIREERYEDAARVKSNLQELKDREVQDFLSNLASTPTHSEAETRGIQVKVQSMFVPQQSFTAFDQYVFAYKVSITNTSSDTVRLLARHWKITDGNGQVQHVRGNGVVGQEPVLQPGLSFEYTSVCPLKTPNGTMEGEYNMVQLDEDGEWLGNFEAKIGQFALKMNETDLLD